MSDPLVVVPDRVWKQAAKRAQVLVSLAGMEEECSAEQIEEAARKLKPG